MSKLQEEYLAHYGVPGMKWDESKKTGNASENIAARKRKLAQKSANIADRMAGSTGRDSTRYHLEQDNRSASGLRKLNAYDKRGFGGDAKKALERATVSKHAVAENMNNIANEILKKNTGKSPAQRQAEEKAAKKEKLTNKLNNAMKAPLPSAKIKARGDKNRKKLEEAISGANKKQPVGKGGTPAGWRSKEYIAERESNSKKNRYR